MKSKYKIIVFMFIIITIMYMYYFNDNSYKNRLMKKIEDATIVVLSNANGDTETLQFNKKIHPVVIFSSIIEVDRPWDRIFESNSKILVDTGIRVEYKNNEQTLGVASILKDKNNEQKYILHMCGVYWEREIEKEAILKLLK